MSMDEALAVGVVAIAVNGALIFLRGGGVGGLRLSLERTQATIERDSSASIAYGVSGAYQEVILYASFVGQGHAGIMVSFTLPHPPPLYPPFTGYVTIDVRPEVPVGNYLIRITVEGEQLRDSVDVTVTVI